ncbi:MAG: Gfo/Idh/MocA family oxidoreductase [[Clostridium] leptum]
MHFPLPYRYYATHFFHVKEMLKNNEFGKIQFVRGAHYQEMEKWPKYWMGLPPMYYGTHAIAPLVMSVGSHITRVHCFGSGVMDKKLYEQYHNPYPIETAIFDFGNGIKGEATRSLFNTAREYTESFNIYGERATFEWQQLENDGDPIIFRKSSKKSCDTDRNVPIEYERIVPRNREDLLPESIRRFTVKNKYYDETNPQVTFEEGGGHGGSHPHLVNEFIQSILEDRAPWIDLYTAANITAAGICAHKSAMQDGIEIAVPDFKK